MSTPIRIGVVGCGSVMQRPYTSQINQLKQRELVETVIACDIREDLREKVLGPGFGYQRFTTDFEEVVSADDVDIVLVTTSMQEHALITKAAREAGKHVLVEKPMATTLEEAAEIVELAKRSPGHLVPAPHVVLSPTYQKMWRHIQQGDIGTPHLARGFYGWAGPSWGRWFYRKGGGSMFDLGVYNVVSLTGLLGPAKRVTGMVGTAVPERMVEGSMMKVETDDNAQICIEFANSCYAVITTGFTIQSARNAALEIYGSDGTIQMLGDDWDPEGYELWQNEVGAWKLFGETNKNWPWADGINHLVECIIEGKTPIITPEHAYHVIEIMEAARAAGQDGQRREIASTFTPPTFFEGGEEAVAAHLRHDPASE